MVDDVKPLSGGCMHWAGPDKKLKLSLNYPASVGRNMDEITRVVDALQLSAKYSVVRILSLRKALRYVLLRSTEHVYSW